MFLKMASSITAGGELTVTPGRFFFAANGRFLTAVSGTGRFFPPCVKTAINKSFVEPLKSLLFYLNGLIFDEIYR
jgi:hypothetical protein